MSTTELTATIVTAYVERNQLTPAELERLIQRVHRTLATLGAWATGPEEPEKLSPAQIKRSIGTDALISFIDGRPYKVLKRHLTTHGLTPEAYRAQFGLPGDYPMTAPGPQAKRIRQGRRPRRQDAAQALRLLGSSALPCPHAGSSSDRRG